ncbi:GDP-mannose 4,6-dehydratase [Candidatus Babela massiliensis]|uniref:GDP-mannose 4,6-dehydratase n=1 Tax=Candidatus Babela massiliensis TaxID=673862 RepID=V6DGQ0_9BACT|nr:GDP-mannose 4,6-dehydratase [Candidatus Babela massiliensis]CDK30745.1 GDP-D-mannose dehydratase [Candidatus Babela massiliensis]
MKHLKLFLLTIFALYSVNSYSYVKKALITGITGQDGSYLAEFLLDKGYEVHGLVRRTSNYNMQKVDDIQKLVKKNNWLPVIIHQGDVSDISCLEQLINDVQPDEIYNLAAQSHVQTSFFAPTQTLYTNAVAVFGILNAVVNAGLQNKTKFYQASTSELFGNVVEIPQSENTKFYPRSPYGIAKLCAHWATINYREAYNVFACNGILFNHESPRRGVDFVTRKITKAVARIKNGSTEPLYLGNLDAKRDWGYAKDYVEAMWLILQQDKPQDYVIATGEAHTVREFVEFAFKEIGIDIVWEGQNEDEIGINKANNQILIKVDPKFFRPTEVHYLLGDSKKARSLLQWRPKTSFRELVKLMVENDCKNYNENYN